MSRSEGYGAAKCVSQHDECYLLCTTSGSLVSAVPDDSEPIAKLVDLVR